MAASSSRSSRSTRSTATRQQTTKRKTSDKLATVSTGWTHLWTRCERIVLRLLNELFPHKPFERTTIFNAIFAEEHKAAGFPAGRDHASLRSQWSDSTRRPEKWDRIKAGPKGRDEQREWQGLEREVRRVAAEQGVVVNGRVSGNASKADEETRPAPRGRGRGKATKVGDAGSLVVKRGSVKLRQHAVGRSRKGGKFVKEKKAEKHANQVVEQQQTIIDGMEVDEQDGEQDDSSSVSTLTELSSENEDAPQDPDIDVPEPIPSTRTREPSSKRKNAKLQQQAIGRSRKGGRFVREQKRMKRASEVDERPQTIVDGMELDDEQEAVPVTELPPQLMLNDKHLPEDEDSQDNQHSPTILNAPPLPMIHTSQVEWASTDPFWTASSHPGFTHISPNTPIYTLGGKAHRVYDINTRPTDMILCNPRFCSTCSTTSQDVTTALGPSSGLPYVHALDLQTLDGRWMFMPKRGEGFDRQNTAYAEWVRRDVVFGDGLMRTVAVCVEDKCRGCKEHTMVMRRKSGFNREVVEGRA